MLHLSKQRVIGGFNRKESQSVARIYELYHRDVLRTVIKSTDGSPDAEDLVADVFYKLISHNGRFKSLKQIEYFLYRTAINTSLDYLRHQRVKKISADNVEKYYEDMQESAKESAQIRDRFDHLMLLAAAKLSPQCKQIIVLGYANGLGNREIAWKLGLSEKTVANLKTLAMKTLKMEVGKTHTSDLVMSYFLL